MAHRWLPSLSALRAFEAAARHESAKQAAEELSVTATAISHQMAGNAEETAAAYIKANVKKPKPLTNLPWKNWILAVGIIVIPPSN